MRSDAPVLLPAPVERILLDDRIRGVPPGVSGLDSGRIDQERWHPARGMMSLPVLTLDERAFIANRDLMMEYVRSKGVDIAPHAKTPISPDLARNLVEAGAWATTVADIRQACVMARAGLDRLIIANEIGGKEGARRLAGFVSAYPDTKIYVFADSIEGVSDLADVWSREPALSALAVLIDVGSGRAGTRSLAEAEAVADAVQASGGRLHLAGVGSYEGNSIQADSADTVRVMGELITRIGMMFIRTRSRLGQEPELILTAGGSLFFDRVVSELGDLVRRDGNARLVLRSGAVFFYDHGICDRFLGHSGRDQGAAGTAALRGSLAPALRLWAEVLSRPEPTLAICGLGMRDVSFDQGFPVVIRLHRGGVPLPVELQIPSVTKLNDQHCFLAIAGDSEIAVGDIVELGVTHACTTIDGHRVIYGLGPDGYVRHAFPTHFG